MRGLLLSTFVYMGFPRTFDLERGHCSLTLQNEKQCPSLWLGTDTKTQNHEIQPDKSERPADAVADGMYAAYNHQNSRKRASHHV